MFGVSEVEAERMDPQQKHVLECVHMAMEDGGFTRNVLHGSNTGVYIGVYVCHVPLPFLACCRPIFMSFGDTSVYF